MKYTAIIEIPSGSNYKYEVNKETGRLILDRVIGIEYPYNYGYIPGTLWEDGDPLDVFVISNRAIPPLTEVKLKVISIIRCIDNGVSDDKIIATIDGDSFYESLGPFHEFTPDLDIVEFLENYKTGFEVFSMGDAEAAEKAIADSMLAYKSQTWKPMWDLQGEKVE